MQPKDYVLRNEENIPSPALIYYKDILSENTDKAIVMAGGADRLWPHVKSHKMAKVISMQLEKGISRFKCATIAEAEMLAECGAPHILLAYPLVGPNIARFIALRSAYPSLHFWAIGDDLTQLKLLGEAATDAPVSLLADVDMGMQRTGVPLEKLEDFLLKASRLPGISLQGVHAYDGHQHADSFARRKQDIAPAWRQLQKILASLQQKGVTLPTIVAGGTPTFPCYAEKENVYLSPGTVFLSDINYLTNLPDMDYIPAAALLTRVVSHPATNRFTLDLGTKAISTDFAQRGVIVGFENALAVLHSEEHWVWEAPDASALPPIGSVLYVIPMHVCPTTALYSEVLVAEKGEIVDCWPVTARGRRLRF